MREPSERFPDTVDRRQRSSLVSVAVVEREWAMNAVHFVEMVLDVRSVKRYPGVGAVTCRSQEGERTAEAESHHRHFAVTSGMLLEIGNHVGKIFHAQLEIIAVVAREGAFATVVGPGQGTWVTIAPEHVRGGSDKSLGRERVCVIRHIAVDPGNG